MLSCESSNKIVKITDPIDCPPYEITYDKRSKGFSFNI